MHYYIIILHNPDFRFLIPFFFLERPVRIYIRYLSVGMSNSAVLEICHSLFDGEQICAHPILTKDEIKACIKPRFVNDKDARHNFNMMFGIASKYVNRNIKKSPAEQMKGKLQNALQETNLRHVTFAHSQQQAQEISISSSENLGDPTRCIFQISSAHIKHVETCIREAKIAENSGDVRNIIALVNDLASLKLSEVCNVIKTCMEKLDSSETNSIRDIMISVPMEFLQAPNGSTVRAARAL